MASATYTLFRNAIIAAQQVTCVYDGRMRALCLHIICKSKAGEESCVSDIDINVHVRNRRKP